MRQRIGLAVATGLREDLGMRTMLIIIADVPPAQPLRMDCKQSFYDSTKMNCVER